MAASTPQDAGTDPSPGIEISAGTLHLRSWTAADGELPVEITGPDSDASGVAAHPDGTAPDRERIVFAVLHATTGERMAVLALDCVGPADATAELRCWVEPAHRETDVAERATGTARRWAAAELGVTVRD